MPALSSLPFSASASIASIASITSSVSSVASAPVAPLAATGSAGLVALLVASIAAAGCALILGLLLATGLAWRLATDVPNHRSLHTRATPRIGGWGVVPVTLVAIAWCAPSLWLIGVGTACVAIVSQIDDRRALPARVRFAVHIAAVAALVIACPARAPWWALAALAFLMLWLVNLYNFMDGADGLAGGMTLCGFGAYGAGALLGVHPMPELAWASAAIAGAAAGFLLFNFHPARLFLGDAGSIPAGFLAGALGYWGWRGGAWPVWFPAFVFAPFIADATVTLLRRLARGEKFWHPHREHYYQYMVRCGIGHARTALLWYAVMLTGAALALWALWTLRAPGAHAVAPWWGAGSWAALAAGIVWAVALVSMGIAIDARWRRFQSAPKVSGESGPASQSSPQPGSRSGSQSNPHSILHSGLPSASHPASSAALNAVSHPGSQPISQPVSYPGSHPGSRAASHTVFHPAPDPAFDPASCAASDRASRPAPDPAFNSGFSPVFNPGFNPTAHPIQRSAAHPASRAVPPSDNYLVTYPSGPSVTHSKALLMLRSKAFWLSFSAFLFDVCAIAAAWLLAHIIRFNSFSVIGGQQKFWYGALADLRWVMPVYAVMFVAFGLYRGIWVFASLPDLIRISRATLAGAFIVMIAAVLIQPDPGVPRSVLILSPALLFLVMGGARAAYRMGKEFYLYGGLVAQGKPVIVLGAGGAGANLARELSRSAEWRLVGLLDDDPAKQGREIYGYKVLGPISALARQAKKLRCEHAIIAIPSASVNVQRRIATLCVRAGVNALVLPVLMELSRSQAFLSQVRHIDLEDLLGREAVQIDTPHVKALLHRRVVMVTGAGGSIGSELCRQILRFAPAQIIAVDQSEYAMYALLEEIRERFPEHAVVPVIGDIKDTQLLDHVMGQHAPHIVFHAAAYKHVPLMEELNAWQAVRNNVLGTYRVARAAIEHEVGHFVLISTDKAVNPVNVMGASKRLAEMACQALQQGNPRTRFATVRFGNVLGSAGSVIPKFQQQIARGGPVTVTHPEITRFFMTIPEAAQLVLQASSMGHNGEIFILDMGRPVKIADLAHDLIRLCGLDETQIRVVFTGLRPGEKLYEELLANDETTRRTPHPKLRIARARRAPEHLLDELLPWLMQRRIPVDGEVRRELRRWIPEYRPVTKPMLTGVIDRIDKPASAEAVSM